MYLLRLDLKTNKLGLFIIRYLDLSEAIDEPDGTSALENGDFASTDIPYDFLLPEVHYVESEETREEVRDWVISASMDHQVGLLLHSHVGPVGALCRAAMLSSLPTFVLVNACELQCLLKCKPSVGCRQGYWQRWLPAIGNGM